MRLVALGAALALAAAGCASDDPAREPAPPAPTKARAKPVPKRPAAPRCPAGAANCATAAGRIIFMERVDPDGDGDLHLVLAGGRVTAPGLSVIDVAPRLRPRRDPRIGDWAAAAGPVYRGSYGQHQIQAERLVLWPRR